MWHCSPIPSPYEDPHSCGMSPLSSVALRSHLPRFPHTTHHRSALLSQRAHNGLGVSFALSLFSPQPEDGGRSNSFHESLRHAHRSTSQHEVSRPSTLCSYCQVTGKGGRLSALRIERINWLPVWVVTGQSLPVSSLPLSSIITLTSLGMFSLKQLHDSSFLKEAISVISRAGCILGNRKWFMLDL